MGESISILKCARERTWYPIRVFAFFIEFTEVNAYLTLKYFLNMKKIDEILG